MTKSLKIISAIFLLFFSSVPLIYAADPPVKDLFYTQAQEVLNSPPVYGVQENVDPFSGYLTLLHTDVSIPGNGGLDIKIMRRYNSAVWSRRDVPWILAADKELNPLGLGWSMHMGIVRNAYGSNLDGCFAVNNPVVEMPDGSQHVMYNVPNTANTFISKDYWIYKVLPNGISELTLTDGTVYTFAHSSLTGPGNAGYYAYNGTAVAQVTSIRNAAGTASLQITYDKQTYALVGGYSVLKTIKDNFNRVVTFNYATSSVNTPQLTSITYNNKTLIGYKYAALTVSGAGTFNTLTRAYLPIPGEYATTGNWNYSYSSSNYQLQTITYPTGGTITYTHSDVMFHTGTWPGVTFSVVTKKITGGRGITAGTWNYAYSTGGTSGNITTLRVRFSPPNLITQPSQTRCFA